MPAPVPSKKPEAFNSMSGGDDDGGGNHHMRGVPSSGPSTLASFNVRGGVCFHGASEVNHPIKYI